MNRDDILDAVWRIQRELKHINKQPVKNSYEDGGNRFVNVMTGHTGCGLKGAKIIAWDEDSGEVSARMLIHRNGGVQVIKDAELVTQLRCGVMAVIAISRHYKPGRSIRLGMIGQGKMARAIEGVISKAYDVKSVVWLNSTATRGVDGRGYHELNECDVIVSATSAREDDPKMEWNSSRKANCYVSFDGGFILGQSFRKNRSFVTQVSDYPVQLWSHYTSEFPGEEKQLMDSMWIGEALEDDEVTTAYIYGTCCADLIVADILMDNGEIDAE